MPYTVNSEGYYYYPNTLTTSSSGSTLGISTNSNAYSTLFSNTNYYDTREYWLGSSCAIAYEGVARFGLRCVADGVVSGEFLWDSGTGVTGSECGVRAVVSLKSDIKLTANGANSWKLSK